MSLNNVGECKHLHPYYSDKVTYAEAKVDCPYCELEKQDREIEVLKAELKQLAEFCVFDVYFDDKYSVDYEAEKRSLSAMALARRVVER